VEGFGTSFDGLHEGLERRCRIDDTVAPRPLWRPGIVGFTTEVTAITTSVDIFMCGSFPRDLRAGASGFGAYTNGHGFVCFSGGVLWDDNRCIGC
jgi:hypothetical protein